MFINFKNVNSYLSSHRLKQINILLLTLFLITPLHKAIAAEIGKFSKKQAIVHLNGDSVEIDQTYFVIDPSSLKKKAKIKIDKIVGDKAKATILKGKVEEGYQLVLQNSKESNQNSEASESHQSLSSKELVNSWGVLGSYIMNSMNAKRTSGGATATSSMTGSTFGLDVFYNFVFASNLSLKFTGSYEQMTVTGSIANPPGCGTSGVSCDANITYLSGYGHANYYLSTGNIRPLVGVGLGFLFPMSKSSSALNTDKIAMSQVVNIALGADIRMSKDTYLPLLLQYNYFAPSDTVSASMIMLKAGWAWE